MANTLVFDLSRHSDQNLLVIYDNEKMQTEWFEQKYEAGEKTLHHMQQITYHRAAMNEAAKQLEARFWCLDTAGDWYYDHESDVDHQLAEVNDD